MKSKLIKYSNEHDKGAFDGIPKRECPALAAIMDRLANGIEPDSVGRLSYECQRCHGHGKWHLIKGNSPRDITAKQTCPNCYGWGYVSEQFKNHIHDWEAIEGAPPNSPSHHCRTCGTLTDRTLERMWTLRNPEWKIY